MLFLGLLLLLLLATNLLFFLRIACHSIVRWVKRFDQFIYIINTITTYYYLRLITTTTDYEYYYLLLLLLLLLHLAINLLLFLRIACYRIFRWVKVYVVMVNHFDYYNIPMMLFLCLLLLLANNLYFSLGLLVTAYSGMSKYL